ncbi:MAG: T9SS type A sorting domain-containing protein [Bacteroidia bacterium]|nr:T9SS type A sorting domain-containing protein [Bacteroidia bacterium]
MKKHLLSILAIISSSFIFGQSLPNGGFEAWTITNYENPQFFQTSNYKSEDGANPGVNATKTTDAYHGQYAIKLTTVASGTNNLFAFFANGDPGNSPIKGGIPYSQKPSGVRLYYKSNIIFGDTAIVLACFKKAGVTIGTYFYKIGQTQTAYTLLDVNFSPALPVNPDSIVIAAASSNAFANFGIPGNSLQIDSITFKGVSSQPANFNASFEQWQALSDNKLNGWITYGELKRTTDAYSGTYATELQTAFPTFGGGSISAGEAGTGYNNGPGGPKGGSPYTNLVDTLVLYYKYIPADPTDQGECYVMFKKNGVQIHSTFNALPISPSYQKVSVTWSLSTAPDTVNVSFRSSKYPYQPSYNGSDLKVDNMYFTSQKVPISDFVSPLIGCVGQPIQLMDKSGNMANAWGWIMPGGIPGSSTAQAPVVIYNTPGTKTISMVSSNQFGSGSLVAKTITIFTVPVVASTSTVTACGGGTAILTASGAGSYTWSTGANTPTISVTPSVTSIYTVVGTTNGCSDAAVGVVVVPQTPKPNICMVTVDSLNQFNEIYWDKADYPNLDSMIIYREVISNTYKRIGAVSKSALSMWVDTARNVGPANGDPNISTYRYKIQVRDTCGQYGPKSLWHNTVFFTHNSSGTFFWTNNYMVEGPINPVQTYSLLVNTNPTLTTSSFVLVGTTTGNQSTLADPFYNFYANVADWRVEADLGYACTPTQKFGNNSIAVKATKTRSNIQNNRTAISVNELQFKNKFRVYPNPSNGIINIESMIMDNETNLIVRNILGQEIHSDKMTKGSTSKTIDLSKFAKGVYSLELTNNNNKAVYKLVTE